MAKKSLFNDLVSSTSNLFTATGAAVTAVTGVSMSAVGLASASCVKAFLNSANDNGASRSLILVEQLQACEPVLFNKFAKGGWFKQDVLGLAIGCAYYVYPQLSIEDKEGLFKAIEEGAETFSDSLELNGSQRINVAKAFLMLFKHMFDKQGNKTAKSFEGNTGMFAKFDKQ